MRYGTQAADQVQLGNVSSAQNDAIYADVPLKMTLRDAQAKVLQVRFTSPCAPTPKDQLQEQKWDLIKKKMSKKSKHLKDHIHYSAG